MTVDEFNEFSTYREQADGTIIYQGRIVGRGGLRQVDGHYEFSRLNGSVAIMGPRMVAPWASADAEPAPAATEPGADAAAEEEQAQSFASFASQWWAKLEEREREAEARAEGDA